MIREGKKVLHVGVHKTGTTSFQAVLQRNKKKLLENGVFCPPISDIHKKLTYPYIYRGESGFEISDFYDASCHSAILSDEDLLGKYDRFVEGKAYPNATSNLEKAKNLLGWESMDVWITLRDYGEWLESSYLQKLKRFGEFFLFESYCEAIDFQKLSWVSLLEEISSLYFVDKVNVLFYEEFNKDNNVIYSLVEESLGVGGLDLRIPGGKRNPSISGIGYHVLSKLDDVSKEDFKKINKYLLKEFPSHQYGKPTVMTHTERSLLKERYCRDAYIIKKELPLRDEKIAIQGGE